MSHFVGKCHTRSTGRAETEASAYRFWANPTLLRRTSDIAQEGLSSMGWLGTLIRGASLANAYCLKGRQKENRT